MSDDRTKNCPVCTKPCPKDAHDCPHCRYEFPYDGDNPYKSPSQREAEARVHKGYVKKRRMLYVLLAILIGTLGVHNFYAGRTGPAVAQLLMTIGGGLLGLPLFLLVVLWAIGDMIAVTEDGEGVRFG